MLYLFSKYVESSVTHRIEAVFTYPNPSYMTDAHLLERKISNDISQIFGTLNSNYFVVILKPNINHILNEI